MVLSRFERVSQVLGYLNNKKVVQSVGTSMHNLVADRFGNAIVVETGENENQMFHGFRPRQKGDLYLS